MGILETLLIAIILIIIGIFAIKILLKVGKVALTILLNMILGFILLFLFNLLPFFKIPINLLTVLFAGFGGIFGVGILILAKIIGLY